MGGRKKDNTGNGHEDESLWAYVTADVTPMPGREVLSTPPGKATKTARTPKATAPVDVYPATAALQTPPSRDMDKRSRQRLERGQMPIEAVLDLHGQTQQEAYENLHQFISRCASAGMRCVLVITGKGRAGTGVLKARVPEWLESIPNSVLRVSAAQQKHGGGGAFYVLLRRSR